MISRFRRTHDDWEQFPKKVVVQLNDTHPAVAILELMRIFLDEQNMGWEASWKLVQATFAYTNHTLLPEALETWSEALFERVLPIYKLLERLIAGLLKSNSKKSGMEKPTKSEECRSFQMVQ